MKKFFTAIMLLAGASMIAACVKSLVPDDNVNGNENENGNGNEQTEQTDQADQTMDSKVLEATFPLNVKIVMKNQPSYNTAEEDITLIKLGNEWFYENRGYRYVLYLYCQFAKDGKTLKAFGGALQEDSTVKWTNLLTSGDESYLNFAGFAKNSECHVLFDAGVPAGNCKKYGEATSDKETILGVECTRYDYDFVVKADYWVDDATKIVYKFVNYLDKDKESKNATFEIKSWDTSVKAFEWDKPE